ncbi:MAG: nucleoside triphosphate pyrophosphohydrolase [Pseudomonadota bacterium]
MTDRSLPDRPLPDSPLPDRPLPDRAASDRLVFDRGAGIERLLEIMARLRAVDGCPWDREQTWESIAPYTIEEAAEVAEAIARRDTANLREELGDLLLQVVYHARIGEEAGVFALDDIVRAISDKMVARHPHVFGTEPGGPRADPATVDWEALKAAERAAKGERRDSALDGIPGGLPALLRALKLTRKAAKVGFDWTDPADVLAKIDEEARELVAEIDARDAAKTAEEYGDLLFVMVNLGRHLDVDPEAALSAANAKFERRFRSIETALKAEGRRPEDATLAEMDALWDAAKRSERKG